MFNVSNAASIINVLIALVTVGALSWVFTRQRTKGLADLQTKIIETQKEALAAQDAHLTELKAAVARLQQTVAIIQTMLRKRGTFIRIEGDYVTIETRKDQGTEQTTARISVAKTTPDNAPTTDTEGNHEYGA